MAKPALLVYIVNMVSAVISIVAVLIITWGAIIIFIDLIKLEIRRFKGLKPYYERTIYCAIVLVHIFCWA